MRAEKKRRCNQAKRDLANARLNLRGSLSRMNIENDRAINLRNEIEDLESEIKNVGINAVPNILGLGNRRSSGGISLALDGVKASDLYKQIKEKTSELRYAIEGQDRYKEESETYEREISNLQNRIDQMGCR